MSFIDEIKNRAKKDIKKIVLPESEDDRTLRATSEVLKQKFAEIILVGNKEKILKRANELNLENVEEAEIIDPVNSDKYDEFVEKFYELRKNKGMTIEKAKEYMLDNTYFGMMMVKQGYADGLVSGAVHSTSDTLRPALQILKTAPGTKLVSAFFMMIVPNCEFGEDGVFLFSDSGLNENPDSEALSEIAISSSKSFDLLVGKEPKIAMLSYSSHGSAKSDLTEKVINATNLVKEKAPELLVDGELQLDAAIIPEVAEYKAKGSPLKGKANVLIFPDLNSGNIGYKLVQRLAKAEAYGPLCQGIAKPVNDLSRGCNSKDIEGVIAITAVQAQEQEK
ncbi:MAG TPA: phosphate acetyltransferase [Clostridiaceae bacterium]|jgi:phosphate acetyltransferase|nr:phosphate acetyltransferase [Clostridia bacterium]HJJ12793.1 phosphate acetyltransferase [Clostridiaceae bacterium]